MAADHAGLAAALPEIFVAARVRSRRGGVSVVEERLRLGGAELLMMVRHSCEPPHVHTMAVLGGDAKGSRIVERYGDAAGGGATALRVRADLRLGCMAGAAAAFGVGRAGAILDGLEGMYGAIAALAERADGGGRAAP